ncbi:MAG: aminotransferase class III-fold pyridoxal phosphate-dependent enzyme [Candidatus Thorarchaeota archaeon]|nr:MAG: aminotransferase class III-fold pyridoxal phosphate-dependent enzyme [Candidatus Thorarchaeota archaeon]
MMDTRDPERPNFTTTEAGALASNLFNLIGAIKEINELPSERDQNFHIVLGSDQEYVLKISTTSEDIITLEMQNNAMHHLADNIEGQSSPVVYKSRNDIEIEQVKDADGNNHYVRLLSFIPGKLLSQVNPQQSDLLEDYGRFIGSVSKAFSNFDHIAAHREFYWDLKRASSVIGTYLKHITDAGKQDLVQYFLELYDSIVLPIIDILRSSVIHNDANDNNIVVSNPHNSVKRMFGILDFGDMVHSCTINELAIAIAYAILDKPDPISVAQEITAGYHKIFPISELELELLFPLICARLATSVSVCAYQKTLEPDNEYLTISETSAWQVLAHLRSVPPRYFTYSLRSSIGLEPCSSSAEIREWLLCNAGNFASPIGKSLNQSNSVVVDLSVGSTDVPSPLHLADVDLFAELAARKIKGANAEIGVGRYNEARLIYSGDQYVSAGGESRTIHMAVDLLIHAGAPVHAVYDGTIHSFQDNDKPLDNGPTIIVEHKTSPDGPPFYVLYGHLSRESLVGLEVGTEVKKGEQIASVGKYPENGGWIPHLHFQLIADMMDLSGDFFGVAPPSKRDVWLSICPDPNLILQIPESLFPEPWMSKDEILKVRSEHVGKSLGVSYKKPLHIVRGFMQYLYDEEGRQYLDVRNNVPQVGHSNPYVVDALARQAAVLNTNTRYLHENLVTYARRLSSTMPGNLKICFFVNSGSEANELALRLAMTHTKQKDLIIIDGAYHGNTDNLVGISPYKHNGPGGEGPPPHVHMVNMPDPYRGKHKHADSDAGKKYAEDVGRAIQDIEHSNRGVCAFICESLMGCGGQIIFPDGYLKEAFKRVREAGGVCIADEVQIGFGRVGTHFWGFETQDVIPDIVTMGKPIGNGHPIGAVITTPEIAESFNTGMEFFSTTGGNTVSCAVGMAVLDVIENQQLQQHALEIGTYLKSQIESLKERHCIIGDVRGIGFYIGVELVRDEQNLTPATEEAKYIVERLKDMGLLVSVDGPLNNVLKIKPPLIFTKENADFLVESLESILSEDPVRLM